MSKLATPMRAIRLKCMDCTCQQIVEVRECEAEDCPLWHYRMGKRPSTLKKRAEAKAAGTVNKQPAHLSKVSREKSGTSSASTPQLAMSGSPATASRRKSRAS